MKNLDFSEWIPALLVGFSEPHPRNGKLDAATSLVFADWLEENGEEELAKGWRKIGDRVPCGGYDTWYWYVHTPLWPTKWGNEIGFLVGDLLKNCKKHKSALPDNWWTAEYPTPFEALLDLAQALGELP